MTSVLEAAVPGCTCKTFNPECAMSPAAHASARDVREVLRQCARLAPAWDILADAREELARYGAMYGPPSRDVRRSVAKRHYDRLPRDLVEDAVEVVAALRALGGWSA